MTSQEIGGQLTPSRIPNMLICRHLGYNTKHGWLRMLVPWQRKTAVMLFSALYLLLGVWPYCSWASDDSFSLLADVTVLEHISIKQHIFCSV